MSKIVLIRLMVLYLFLPYYLSLDVQLKSTESGYAINRSSDTLESSTELDGKFDGNSVATGTTGTTASANGGGAILAAAAANKANHLGANGSVITMTMKNNHLIVETEERNDMARDARETKMHYSPSEKDGLFVVEVARGADSTGVCNGPIHSVNKQNANGASEEKNEGNNENGGCQPATSREDGSFLNNEEIQVHPPPDGINDDEILTIDEDGAVSMSSPKLNGEDSMRPICGSANTGLSQSDLSITSSSGSNKDYCYGTQQQYTIETKGYQSSSPCQPSEKHIIDPSTDSKPIIMAAIYKQESLEPGSPRPVDAKSDVANSDLSICSEKSEPTIKEEILIEEQKKLGNGIVSSDEKNANVEVHSNDPVAPNQTENCDTTTNGDCEYDSLISLPAPPTTDEIKYLNEITLLDNNNMDSLPPPPPPEVIVDGPLNGQS